MPKQGSNHHHHKRKRKGNDVNKGKKKFETEEERTAYYEQKQAEKLERQQKEIARLEKGIKNTVPPRGINPFASKSTKKKKKKKEGVYELGLKFSDLPISKRTASALALAKFKEMTPIQHASIIHALAKRDILGSAKTGSGKTLSFVVPVIENLYRNNWEKDDGLGALILSPSRELALQIFDVLRTVGKHHRLSAGMIVGGRKHIEEEAKLLPKMNILVATPGRLLQHLKNAYGFDCSVLQMLVLDEADRLLEEGFQKDISAILKYLPASRQTMLFSATQTKSVKQLASLSLSRQTTEYISVSDIHGADVSSGSEESDKFNVSMPRQLKQYYIKINLHDKLNMLHALLKANPKQKAIVFVSTTKQASFCYHIFKRLPLMMKTAVLRGRMSQNQRVKQQNLFTQTNQSIILFATNVAARGLDFPGVDTVIQLDVPDSMETYIHRVGRTARYQSSGKAYIFVTPEEEKSFIHTWSSSNLPMIKEKKLKTDLEDMKHAIGSIVSADIRVQYEAMKYYETYLRYIEHGCSALHHDISVNSYTEDQLTQFSTSLGLFERPNVNLERPVGFEHAKNKALEQQEDETEEEYIQRILYGKKKASKREFVAKTLKRGVAFQFQDAYQKLVGAADDNDDDDFFETISDDEEGVDAMIDDESHEKNYFEKVVSEKAEEDQALDASYMENLRKELSEVDHRDKSLKKELLKKQRALLERDALSNRLQSQYTRKLEEEAIEQDEAERQISRKRKRADMNQTQQELLQQTSPKKTKPNMSDEALALALIEQGLS